MIPNTMAARPEPARNGHFTPAKAPDQHSQRRGCFARSPDAEGASVVDKILLVEDDAYQQRTIATFLKNNGYDVLIAADGKSACQLLARIPDIIVTDLFLAGSDGMHV